MSQKKSAASNMKASEACESFKSMNDQRSESLSTPFLNTETVSYGSGWSAQECGSGVFCVCVLGNIMAIVLSENICPFFFFFFAPLKLQKAHKVESGHKAFMVIKGQRMRLTFRASAGLWEHNAWQQFFLAFPPLPRLLWAMLTSQRLTPQTSMIFHRDSNIHMAPPPLRLLPYHTQEHMRAHALSSSVCTSASRSVPSGITAQLQAMEV